VIILEAPPVAKTISVAQLGHGGVSRAIREAEDGAVLVSKENRPAAWIVSAARLARVAAARGVELDVYERALELLAVDLYRQEVVTLGQAARLAGMALGDFIDLCRQLRVPVLWEPPGEIGSEVDALAAAVGDDVTAG
jgi:predicted HTH domain antitoxin